MAWVENMSTGEMTFLRSAHLCGRNAEVCHTHINDEYVSRFHATLCWSGTEWLIEDHSRNGTFIDGELHRKACVRLNKNTMIQFGRTDATCWKVVDDEAPSSFLKSLTIKNRILVLEDYMSLPPGRKSEIVFYRSENGSWMAQAPERRILLSDGMRLTISNEEWEFVDIDVVCPDTPDYGQLAQHAWFKFSISANEEDIRLKLIVNDDEYDLGRRTYNFLLLTLARKRLADWESGFPLDDQGWLSMELLENDVSKELGHYADSYYLNLLIYRFRKRITDMKPLGRLFSNAVERRTGELRFAFPQLKVFKDNNCIGEIMMNENEIGRLRF